MVNLESFISIGFGLLAIVAFLIAKYQDPIWRAKILRKLKKRDYGILNILSRDGKTIRRLVVNLEEDAIQIDNNVWIIAKSRIYRQHNESMGFSLKRDTTSVKWTEGIPVIFVDMDSIKPLTFDIEESTVKPDEVGANLMAWINNQIMKKKHALPSQDKLIKIALVGIAIVGFLSYLIFTQQAELLEVCRAAQISGESAAVGIGEIVNGTQVIKG